MAQAHRTPGETFAGHTQLEVRACPTCGVTYAVPERLLEVRREKGGNWYCPNGHSLHFVGEPEADKLRRQLEVARDREARERARRDQAEASARAQKAAATRARNERDRARRRVAAGVCPCCTRTFKQLGRHMKSQHPDYRPESA